MNIFQSLFRTHKKNKVMKKAIKAETSTYDTDVLLQSRRQLYDFLLNDEILSQSISNFSFEQFSQTIDILKSMGLTYSSRGDYYPIAVFCFLPSLSATASYFFSNEYTPNDYYSFLCTYFGKPL